MTAFLIRSFGRKCCEERFLRHLSHPINYPCLRRSLPRHSSSTKSEGGGGFQDLDKPIKFTTSAAADWKAESTHGGRSKDPDTVECQPYVVSLSVAVFLLYFLALREENDVDERMKVPLWERVPGLERQQLQLVLQYNQDHGLPTQDILNRIEEIKQQQPNNQTDNK